MKLSVIFLLTLFLIASIVDAISFTVIPARMVLRGNISDILDSTITIQNPNDFYLNVVVSHDFNNKTFKLESDFPNMTFGAKEWKNFSFKISPIKPGKYENRIVFSASNPNQSSGIGFQVVVTTIVGGQEKIVEETREKAKEEAKEQQPETKNQPAGQAEAAGRAIEQAFDFSKAALIVAIVLSVVLGALFLRRRRRSKKAVNLVYSG